MCIVPILYPFLSPISSHLTLWHKSNFLSSHLCLFLNNTNNSNKVPKVHTNKVIDVKHFLSDPLLMLMHFCHLPASTSVQPSTAAAKTLASSWCSSVGSRMLH